MRNPPTADNGKTKFYFAFPDRAYHYECAQCDALCCRGHGIGTAAQETPELLSLFPELAWAVTKSGPKGSNFINPSGGCFFLTASNLCQVEEQHGRETKPGVCVVFPFNDFSRLGDVVVVRPHFLCPLRLLPGEGVGRHADLEKMIVETGVIARALEQPGPEMSSRSAGAIVQREEIFRDQCGAAIGVGRFEDFFGSKSEDKKEFIQWRDQALRLWGISSAAAPRDYLDDILLALASPLRVRLFRMSERQRLKILFLAGAYARNVARIGARPLTLQGTHQMIVNVLGVLRLLARGNVSLPLPSTSVMKGVEFQNPELTVAFFQVIEELQAGRKLFDTLEGAVPSRLSNIERALFFHQLAQRIRELRQSSKNAAEAGA